MTRTEYSRIWRARNPERNRELSRAYKARNKHRLPDLVRRRKYGLELGEFAQLFAKQKGYALSVISLIPFA